MTDPQALRRVCVGAVENVGLTPVGELFHRFPALVPTSVSTLTAAPASADGNTAATAGVTGVVLLAESHLAVHTWPELGAVTLDVYVCNLGADNSQRAEALLAALLAAFEPVRVERHRLLRGGAQPAK